LKTTLITAALVLFFILPGAYSQTYFYQKAKGKPQLHAKDTTKHPKPSQIDIYSITQDNYQADLNSYSNYISQQADLINTLYNYTTDTSNMYGTKNYDCINSITVAFDTLYDPFQNLGFRSDTVANFGIDTIFVPIIQVHHNPRNQIDVLEIQLDSVDVNGYPSIASPVSDTIIYADSTNNYNIGSGNDYTIKTIKWILNNYQLSQLGRGTKFAVTVTYTDTSKLDSCWFIYGYGYFDKVCPDETDSVLALPTNFTKINAIPHPFYANSFAAYNAYNGYGQFPTKQGDNLFYPCDANDVTYTPGFDGANYLQDIHIYVSDSIYVDLGVPNIRPTSVKVNQNYPNPFTSNTTITYSFTKASPVSFSVTDITGREIIAQNFGLLNPGQHTVNLNGKDFSPGVYFYSITCSGFTVTKKMVVY
jgi:hypothetical protein